MMAFDTDVLTEILLGNPTMIGRAAPIPPPEPGVPVVVIEEIIRGRLQVIRQAEAGRAGVSLSYAYELFEETLRDVQQLTVLSNAPQADDLYRQWRHECIRIGTHDLRIAAICVAHAATLISRNRRDFTRVPGLRVEFWE